MLGATVGVILFGALVRITGSGAGCGQHWPTCQGSVLFVPTSLETLIEYTHRATSAALGVGSVVLLAYAFLMFPRRHPVRRWSTLSVLLVGLEAVVGMLLVRLALVGDDASTARAIVMPAHLVSTLLLLGTIALSAFHSMPASAVRLRNRRAATLLAGVLLAFLVIAASGAVTALGDTVYPVHASRALTLPVGEHSQALRFLESSRSLHPLLAAFLIASMLLLPRITQGGSPVIERLGYLSLALMLAQGGVGAINVLLTAPAILQVVHLFVTCVIWITLVWLFAELWAPRAWRGSLDRSTRASPVQVATFREGASQ